MKPQALQTRILTALELRAMGTTELAMALDCSVNAVSGRVSELRRMGTVEPAGLYKPIGKRWRRRWRLCD